MVFIKAIIVLLDEILDNALLEIVNVSKASANKNQNAIAYLIDFEDTTSSLKISVLINIYPDYQDGDLILKVYDLSYDILIFDLKSYIDLTNEDIKVRIQAIINLVEDLLKNTNLDSQK